MLNNAAGGIMKKEITLAAILALIAFAPSAPRAAQFDSSINDVVVSFAPNDAFAGIASCRILDAQTLLPYPIDEAIEAIEPCLSAVSRRYSTEISAKASILDATGRKPTLGLTLDIPSTLPAESPLIRDINHALGLRKGQLLGHPTVVRRNRPATRSAVQQALNACFLPSVVQPIESSKDFIRIYENCLKRNPTLKVQEIRPAPGRPMAINLLSNADQPTVASLTGTVSVNCGAGPVNVMVIAYSKTVYLP